ncbi:hypothetical protein [Pedobacter frigoris]|uniref:hypothetical protein n=1 Tax=Pedobacter frigoris TaxID=2571272 RepID=UPI00292FF159|nr:hypothetical protein [Pedobacter frigoris]
MKELRIVILTLIFALSLSSGQAQTWGEWFNQKKTQKQYLLQQIAALKVYTGYLQKGYEIAKDGLGLIGDLKDGELNLHSNFFNSLKKVSPRVAGYTRVADIMALQLSIVKQAKENGRALFKQDLFNPEEIRYITQVFDRVTSASLQSLEELVDVLTSGKLEMKDDERISRIDLIYKQMLDHYAFCTDFSNQTLGLYQQKAQELRDIQVSRIINNIKD